MGDDLLKKLLILIFVLLFISMGAVSAEGNFTQLKHEIDTGINSIELTQDYKYDNQSDVDLRTGVLINKSNFVVNGNGNALNGVNITFNINGVFYNRTTDENGTARLNIRLVAGEYIITSQYENAVISNKITIIAKED